MQTTRKKIRKRKCYEREGKNASKTAEYPWGRNRFALSGKYQLRRSSNQIGFIEHYVEFTNCAVQATKLEWKSQSTSEIFANSISQIPRALATANQRLRFLRRLLTKKRPGTVVCGYRKVPATDRLTGFATAAPRTPERTRAPVAQGYWLSTVRREHRRAVCGRTTVKTPTSCGASP